MRIDDINRLTLDEFVTKFGPVYESTPSLAAAAWASRPFRDVAGLVDAFRAAAASLDEPAVLALLQAHPRLAAPAAMSVDSSNEQRSAGLTDLDHETQARID
jgi:2-oxo-4-hydroxy-4-carboxy--5-ureidoimidazoline (OHCU) decarboxylase